MQGSFERAVENDRGSSEATGIGSVLSLQVSLQVPERRVRMGLSRVGKRWTKRQQVGPHEDRIHDRSGPPFMPIAVSDLGGGEVAKR